jgi:hypothetical protein
MKSLKKLKLTIEIVFNFFKSGNYLSEKTLNEDLLMYMRNSEKYKNLVD